MKIDDFFQHNLYNVFLLTISAEMQRLPQINAEAIVLLQRFIKLHK